MKIISAFVFAFILAVLSLSAAETLYPKTLEQYEKVRAALVVDDLSAAKKAALTLAASAKMESASEIQDAIQKLADSSSLKEARAAFQTLSLGVEKWVKGQKGYFIVTCPMIQNSVWIQTTDKIGNPYAGKAMQECGEIRK